MTSSGSYSYRTTMIAVVLFAVAMGYFEAAIVVYLRELYYSGGISFPLALAPKRIIVIELFREASTIIMLIAVAALAGKKFWERFGYFIIIFGLWDIFYYIWLKVTINVSITRLFYRGIDFRPTRLTWLLAILATLVILYSFMRDINAGLRQAMPEPYGYRLLFIGLGLYVIAYVQSYRKVFQSVA